MKSLALVTALALFAGCVGQSPYVTSGESLEVAGKEFVSTAALFDTGLANHSITVEQYRAWSAFGKRFQATYPVAVQLWKSSVAVGDSVTQGKVTDIITTIVVELAGFYAIAVKAVPQLTAKPDGGA